MIVFLSEGVTSHKSNDNNLQQREKKERRKKRGISMNHWARFEVSKCRSEGYVSIVYLGCSIEVCGGSAVKLSLVWRSLEFLANDLGFRIELVIRGYHLPGGIILNEATFIRRWRFKCFHLKELITLNKCFMMQ